MTAVLAGAVTWYAYYYVFKAGFAEVVPGQVYRSSQPSPAELREMVRKYGLRTVICLRGENEPEIQAVEKVAAELGVKFVSISLHASKLPEPRQMAKLVDALDNAPRPILIHCRQGVDRSGMASAVAALIVGKVGLAKALVQLPLLRANGNHVYVCDVLGQYKGWCARSSANADDPAMFRKWLKEHYTGQATDDPQLVPRIPLISSE